MATAPLAGATGTAYETFAAPAWVWQVAWPRVTVTLRGTTTVKYRGGTPPVHHHRRRKHRPRPARR